MRYGLEKTEPFFGEGGLLFNAVCKLNLEGIVAKKLDDPYEPDGRNGGRFLRFSSTLRHSRPVENSHRTLLI